MVAGLKNSLDKAKLWRNFRDALIAVLAGNAIYFFLMPYLPLKARHVPFRQDIGLLVDFWFCLVVFGIVRLLAGWNEKKTE